MDDTLSDADPLTDHPVDRFRKLWQAGDRPDVAAFVAAGGLSAGDVTDLLRLDQQERWRAGEDVPVEWYLEQFPQLAADPDGVQVLIYGEVVARTERGERPALQDFILRFPEHAEFLTLQWEVHTALENAAVGSTMTFETGPPAGPPQPPPVVPGYEVESEVGRGAVGVVYKARQAAINRLCALKVVIGGQRAWDEKLKRFFEEGRAIARLKHPNIVGIYDLGTHETGPFMALEWVGGGTLAGAIAGKGAAADPDEAAKLAATLARAVGHAHQNGIIHRDLKPANILMTEAGEPKVADFGLSKYLDADPALTPVGGGPVGTPTYMAPEQTQGTTDVTPAADVYSLGVVLYELLTGRVPHAGATVGDTLRLVATRDPTPPRELNAKVPRDLETIVLKCLEKDPAKRYPTGHALADDLGRFLAGEHIAARPVGPGRRAWRALARNRRWAAAAVLAVLLAVLSTVGGVAGLVWLDAERRRAELAERAALDRLTEEMKAKADARQHEWQALVSEARAIRRSGRPGQRTAALAKLTAARAVLAELSPDGKIPADNLMVLRDEAIACLALYDVESVDGQPLPPVMFHQPAKRPFVPVKPVAESRNSPLGIVVPWAKADSIQLWDLRFHRPVFESPGWVRKDAFEADGETFRYESGSREVRIRLLPPIGCQLQHADPPVTPESWDRPVRLGEAGSLTAAGIGYGAIQVTDSRTGKPIVRFESPDATRLQPLNMVWKGPRDWVLFAGGIDNGLAYLWFLRTLRYELAKLGLDWDGP